MKESQSSGKDFLSGKILLINKPIGWSSFSVVKKIKSLIKAKHNIKKIKVGHAGTLDPLATGLLIICTGNYTKQISKIQNQSKTYIGEIILGQSTASYDLETTINATFDTKHITKKLLKNTTKQFIGKINQTPPIFSALKKGGERLYEKARRGETIAIESREINIYDFTITGITMPKIHFKITCGKGTYIRAIAHDFGKALNSGGCLSKLSRISIGDYTLDSALDIHSFEKELNKFA